MRVLAPLSAVFMVGCLGPTLELPTPRTTNDAPVPPPAQEVQGPASRAFVIATTADLLSGPLADGRPGDYELQNGVVAFVVGRPGRPAGSGGQLLDAALTGGGQDELRRLRQLSGESLLQEALYDGAGTGARGSAAVVRVTGHDSADSTLEMLTEYVLEPGARSLEIDTTYTNRGPTALAALPVGEAVEWGAMERFVPGRGFAVDTALPPRELATPEGWLLGVAPAVTYGYVVRGALSARHGMGWSRISLAELKLQPGASVRVERWLVVAAAPDATLGEALSSLRGERWPRIGGRVVEDSSGAPISGALISLADRAGRPVALARSKDGAYAQLAPAGDYLVGVEAIGRRGPQHLEVKLGAAAPTSLDVLLSQPGTLRFSVTDNGRPCPAKLTFLGVPPTRTPTLGPADASPGGNLALTVRGGGEVAVAPGHYRVIASRGPAYTIDEKEVEVGTAAPAELSFKLGRAVEIPGLACADLHHDGSSVTADDRAASLAAEGLDLDVRGQQVARDAVGRFGVWPVAREVEVRGQSARQILAELRGAGRVVQIDRPRSGGYFNRIGFDPLAPQLPRDWDGGFDAIEVFSGKDASRSDEPLADWMSLTNRGLMYTAVGGSDSDLIWGQEVGYPRTCAILDEAPTAEALAAAVARRRDALVTNGPFVLVSISGHGMGQLAPAPHGRARLEIEVRAAPWVDTRKLEIWVNGERRGKPIEIPAGRAGLRYKGAVDLRLDRDSSVVVIVRGEASMEPVLSRPEGVPVPTPLAITNPIFVDRDGDGKFTAPMKQR